jgi:hypothetical protein
MIRRLSPSALALAALLLAPAAWAVPALTIGTASGAPGAVVNVPVTFTNDSGVTALQFDVLFDSAKITAVGTPAEGTALANTDHEVDSNLVSAGRFRVLVLSNSLAVIPSGQLVVIPFTLSGSVATGSSVALTLADVEMVEGNALVVAGTSTHGQINVQATGCAVPGDVAPDGVGSGTVTLVDFVIARRKATGALAQNSHDALCGNVFPGAVACTPTSGKIRWCPAPNSTGNPIGLGDVVVIRRLVAQTHTISCVACGPQVTGVTRVAGDVAPRGSGDGRLDIGDVVLALRASVGLEPVGGEISLADVAPARRESGSTLADGNGAVDVSDVVLLLRAAVGLESLAWPQRSLEVRLPSETPRVAYSVRVAGWPAFATLGGVSAAECAGDDAGLDVAGDRWALTCASDPAVTTAAGTLATVTYTGPLVPASALSVESSVVGPALDEIPGLLTVGAR